MNEKKEISYTLRGRLREILEIYPVDRDSLWFVEEPVWEQALPSYCKVRKRLRQGHFGVVANGLDSIAPTAVPVLHGHSTVLGGEMWFHVRAMGLSAIEPSRPTWFDAWHRYPMPWRQFFTPHIRRNMDKLHLDRGERFCLRSIEALIRAKTRSDYLAALDVYQRHPAWHEATPCPLNPDYVRHPVASES